MDDIAPGPGPGSLNLQKEPDMKRLTLVLGLAVLGLAGGAQASSFIGTTDAIGGSLGNSIEGTSDATSSIGNDKVVLVARDDPASFVAGGAHTLGVQRDAALQPIREQLPQLQATDMQLAEAILAL